MKAQEFAFFTCVFTKKLQEIKFEILYTQKRMCLVLEKVDRV